MNVGISERIGVFFEKGSKLKKDLKDALREAIAFGRRGSAPLNISYGPDLDPVLTKMERYP